MLGVHLEDFVGKFGRVGLRRFQFGSARPGTYVPKYKISGI